MKGIADLLDSDMEDSANFIDENSILSSASDASAATTTKASQAKKGKKRHRVTMPTKSRSKVEKSATAAPKKATKQTAAAKRKALEDQINNRDVREAHDAEDSQGEQEIAPPKPKKAPRAPAKTKVPKKIAPPEEGEDEDIEIEQTPAVAQSNHAASRAGDEVVKVGKSNTAPTKSKAAQASRSLVSELQNAVDEVDDSQGIATKPLPQPRKNARDTSKTRQEPVYRARAGSASDTERGDPNLRRKLGDITRKFENIDVKYRNLKEVGVNEANANMEKLRKQCDATVHASNELITSLKKELATQTPQAQEARKLKKQMQSQEAEVNKLHITATELATSLNNAQNEIKALQAKLAAARAENTASKTPASTLKSVVPRSTMAGSAEIAQAAQAAQMKEDLYSDLTGLIIRGVKKTEEGDTYDCIQTGRNGTLHFKLYVDQEDARTASFEETEFLYTPLLDANRDREMIELMPSYLTEDITFARQNAAKFYGRVVDTLTKRRADD